MMTGPSIRNLAFLVTLAGLLSACENAPNPFSRKDNSSDAPITAEAAKSVRLVDRDVEAPEVFQTTDAALWDGRPSLGGVWVASPDAVNPERVILRNEANGKFVIGALFRRERDNPGPKLQISSDAADALGMLAGQPGQLNVTALRREDSPAGAEAAVAAAPAIPETDAAAAAETAAVDPISAAGAALDRADGVAPVDGADATAVAPTIFDDLDPTPQPGETKRAARKRARLAAKAAAAAEVAAPEADPTLTLDAPLTAAEEIAVAPIDAVVADAPVVAPVVAATPTGDATRVQIGIFSVEANAQRAADTLKSGGITSDVRREESNGKAFWSVVATGSGGKAFLAKVKGLGFADAYVVSG